MLLCFNFAHFSLRRVLLRMTLLLILIRISIPLSLSFPSQADPKMPKSRKLLAVPFVGKDVPSRASEFSHPDVVIGQYRTQQPHLTSLLLCRGPVLVYFFVRVLTV